MNFFSSKKHLILVFVFVRNCFDAQCLQSLITEFKSQIKIKSKYEIPIMNV